MPRPQQLLHIQHPSAPAVPAATVLWVRNDDQGRLQVLMTSRAATASFAAGAYVFPGGVLEPTDPQAHHLSTRRDGQNPEVLTAALAGLRESFEELGVLPLVGPDGRGLPAQVLGQLQRHEALWPQLQRKGWRVDAAQLHLLAHWTTDRDFPRRFSVPFFVARMPSDQTPVADEVEQFDPQWIRPDDALSRHQAGNFFLIYPTRRTLERLTAYADATSLLAACSASEAPLWISCPRAGLLSGHTVRFMEDEPPYGELEMVCPDGSAHHEVDFTSHQPTPLLRNLQRMTAPNPGVMTGPGTNCYLVGSPGTGYVVIDPGPLDIEHLERIWRTAGGDIRMIVCTHSHPDHAPGARPLQALCLERPGGYGLPPVLGLASAATARADSQFSPDRCLLDHEQLVLRDPRSGEQHTLQVIFTPGHAANHVCLALLEDGILFSGDHILNGSTTVVNPPDGNMTDYLESLDRLDACCVDLGLDYIAPAHGYVLHQARRQIAKLKAHRLQRESKVMRALQTLPDGNLDDWVRLAYDDVPERIWPVAKRSLEAHVIRLKTCQP